jgi:tetratricopeptide (TPR) repeat protein
LMQDLPFDIDHTVIHQYEHLESDIGHTEVLRFRKLLKKVLQPIIARPETDSPVYTFLHNLDAPKFKRKKKEKVSKKIAASPSISDLVIPAEEALNKNNFKEAKDFFKAALLYDKTNTYLTQRLALVTYKEKPKNKSALISAQNILSKLNPNGTTDPETLGLSGAINKRLYEVTKKQVYLDKAIWFYEKGFYVQQDYYTGINFAYELTVKATTINNKNEAISFYLQSNRIRNKVIEICNQLIKSKSFKDRGDREWVYQSLAQAYLGLNKKTELKKVIPAIAKLSKGDFDLHTFNEQNKKLIDLMAAFKLKHGNV